MSNPAYLRRRAAAEYVRQHWGVPCSEKILVTLACVGGGPVHRRFGSRRSRRVRSGQDRQASPADFGIRGRLMAVLRSSIIEHRCPSADGDRALTRKLGQPLTAPSPTP